jgi:hypothetical protein
MLLLPDIPSTPLNPSLLPSPCQAAQQGPAADPAVYAALKDDPDLKHVFEDVNNNGPAALQK